MLFRSNMIFRYIEKLELDTGAGKIMLNEIQAERLDVNHGAGKRERILKVRKIAGITAFSVGLIITLLIPLDISTKKLENPFFKIIPA